MADTTLPSTTLPSTTLPSTTLPSTTLPPTTQEPTVNILEGSTTTPAPWVTTGGRSWVSHEEFLRMRLLGYI